MYIRPVTLRPPMTATDRGFLDIPAEEYCQATGLMYVRGCEVEGMLDENGRVIEEFGSEPKPRFNSGNRTFRVLLDCNQYREDMDMTSQGGEDVYSSFNLLLRRKPKENNFKAVLETIRDLMNTTCVVPDWLHDIILGYGDPASAHYTNMPNNIPELNFNDTFLDFGHLRASFPGYEAMVEGPPGTGKTDVAVQIISNLYHNFPEQRTLIVTHSNQALNQLFEKIMALDVDERHLLRLGHGEEALETEKDFSRYGRVNYVLAKRIELLDEVTRLQKSLGVVGDVAYTCETARYFFLYQILSRWEEYIGKL